MFLYDPEKAGFSERLTYGLAKALYGSYPPNSSINYIWANRFHSERIITSPYTDRSKMIILQAGSANTGIWKDESIDILDDYRQAFGFDPPPVARIAIMNDSDDTQERSTSYIDFIWVRR